MTAYEKAGTTAVRVGDVDVVSRSIDGRDIALDVTYTLQDEIGERGVLTLLDPEVLSIQRAACDAATIAFARRDGHRVIDLTLQRGRSFDGATIQMRVQWEEDALERRNGSPVCVLPSHVPLPLTSLGPHIAQNRAEPTGVVVEPRLTVSAPLTPLAGTVTDETGALLMVATPLDRQFEKHLVYSDDKLVLGGAALAKMPAVKRRAVRDLLLAVHEYLGSELGRSDHVRALAVYQDGASNYRDDLGQYSALDGRFLESVPSGRFPAERLIVRHFAAIWWRYGVRPAGRQELGFRLGLAAYNVLRWFETRGDRLEQLDEELEFARKAIRRMESVGIESNPAAWEGAHIALALYAANKNGPELANELRTLCASDWGKAIAVTDLVKRLAYTGFRMPECPSEF